jgi:hypothetical protein
MNGNNITDEGVADIKNALVNNSRLKELNLNHNRRVTANEWITFSDVLLNPISSLEVLGLCNSCINVFIRRGIIQQSEAKRVEPAPF